MQKLCEFWQCQENIPVEEPDEYDWAMIELTKDTLFFESTLSLEEVEANVKNVNIGDSIIEALTEVLQNLRKQGG